MPRKARIDAPGALHHIIVRGKQIGVKTNRKTNRGQTFILDIKQIGVRPSFLTLIFSQPLRFFYQAFYRFLFFP